MTTATFPTRPCIHCGKQSHVELDLAKLNRWIAGEFVQDVWPEKNQGERELLMTGTHPKCWDEMFKDEDE